MTRPIRVYVAGAFTSPTPAGVIDNVNRAIDAGNEVESLGFRAFIPHMSYWRDARHPRPYEEWMEIDEDWLEACDVLLRLPGPSSGADREIAAAKRMGIPVFHSVRELAAAMEATEPVVLKRVSGVLVPSTWAGSSSCCGGKCRKGA
jgi:hypothetical protein